MIKNSYLKNILTKEILEKSYFELRSMTAMAERFNTTRLTIARHMNHYGIAHKLEPKYKCNENIFCDYSHTDNNTLVRHFIPIW